MTTDSAAIDERQLELSKWIFDIWKFPDEEPPPEPEAPARIPAEGEAAEGELDAAILDQLPEVPS